MILPVAVVGCGYWGPNLIRNFFSSPRFRVCLVVEKDKRRLEWLRSVYPSIPVSTEYDDALKSDAGLIALATPPESHHALGMAALEAGKHLLLEKPMALSSAHCGALNDLGARKGLKVLVDHTYLFNPAVAFIKDYLRRGELGELRYLDSTRVNLGLFQERINVLWDLAPHDFSIVDYLLERQPDSVAAVGAGHIDRNVENLAYVTFGYGGGLLCHFNFNWLSPVKVRKTVLGGSRKMIVYDDAEPTEKIRIYDHGVEMKPESLKHSLRVDYRTGDIVIPKLPNVEALQGLVEHVWRVIVENEPSRVRGEDGERVVRLIEAAQASMRDGGKPHAFSGG